MNMYSILGLSFWSYLAAGVLAGVIAFLVLMILIKTNLSGKAIVLVTILAFLSLSPSWHSSSMPTPSWSSSTSSSDQIPETTSSPLPHTQDPSAPSAKSCLPHGLQRFIFLQKLYKRIRCLS